jgi:hypothetical protein
MAAAELRSAPFKPAASDPCLYQWHLPIDKTIDQGKPASILDVVSLPASSGVL